MRRLNLTGLFLALLLVLPTAFAQQAAQAPAVAPLRATPALAKAARDAAKHITAEQLKKDLYWVADDARGGRDTPSPGLDETARYIADRLARAKVKPAGDDGTYFQKIELRSTAADPEKSRAEFGGRQYKLGPDFVLATTTGGEVSNAPLVYVGHGWVVRSKSIDAYKGLDVRDKIMVVAGGMAPPEGVTTDYIAKQAASDWENPLTYAQKNGARGIILVPQRFERMWQFGQMMLTRSSFQVARFADERAAAQAGRPGNPPASTIPVITPSAAMLAAIFEGERQTGAELQQAASANTAGQGFDLAASKRMTLSVSVNQKTATTQNVVGVLEGSDPTLKSEYVALGAHYDHVGTGRADKNGDAIFNGADDDGSGTVAVLSIAEAFAKAKRTRRSLLFVWHAAEEKGLWGSEYFTKYPTVPINQIVAQLNIDMIGRSRAADDTKPANKGLSGPDEIYVIGSKMMSTELGALSEAVNASYLNLKYNYNYDAPDDPEQLFYRSDHYNYAARGIPIIFYFDGIHEDYHRQSDSPDKIDYQKMEKVARTVFVLGSELANAPRRPVVDKPLPAERMRN